MKGDINEALTKEQLIEKQNSLRSEIDSLEYSLGQVEDRLFLLNHPELVRWCPNCNMLCAEWVITCECGHKLKT